VLAVTVLVRCGRCARSEPGSFLTRDREGVLDVRPVGAGAQGRAVRHLHRTIAAATLRCLRPGAAGVDTHRDRCGAV